MVLVDSDVWSEAFRKSGDKSAWVDRLEELIRNEEVLMIGPIRQEVLSGIREQKSFEKIRRVLRAFPSQPLQDSIFELAASFFNTCRKNGIQGSHTDFLVCACSVAWKAGILSQDKDYEAYSRYLPIEIDRVGG